MNTAVVKVSSKQPRSQGSLLPDLRVGRVGENPGNEVVVNVANQEPVGILNCNVRSLAVDLVNQGAILLIICQFTRDVIECYDCKLKWFLPVPSYLLYLVSQTCQFCPVN